MGDTRTFLLDLPREARELLADNGVDLVSALRAQGLPVKPAEALDPTADEGAKEIVLAVTAVGLGAVLLAQAIAKVLGALTRNRVVRAERDVLHPVMDGDGKPVLDGSGQPVLYWTKETELLSPHPVPEAKSSIEGEVGLSKIRFRLESGQ